MHGLFSNGDVIIVVGPIVEVPKVLQPLWKTGAEIAIYRWALIFSSSSSSSVVARSWRVRVLVPSILQVHICNWSAATKCEDNHGGG